MRRIFFLVWICLCPLLCSSLKAQDLPNYLNPETWLLGYFEVDRLLDKPHGDWYNKEFDGYPIDNETFLRLSELDLSKVEVLVVLGTWCPDSRREVPRFIKLFQLLEMDEDGLRMLGTDSYKKAPIDNYDDLNIERVPTFIFYRNKSELGRIIEYPIESLEKDMLKIFRVIELSSSGVME